MKTAVMEKIVDQPIDLSITHEEKKSRLRNCRKKSGILKKTVPGLISWLNAWLNWV